MTSATYSLTKTNRIYKHKRLSQYVYMILTDEELEIETKRRELTNTPKRTDLYKNALKYFHDIFYK